MKKHFMTAGMTSALVLASAVSASAALLDFTDNASYDVQTAAIASGTLADGNTWTLLPTPATFELSYVAAGAPAGATPPLAGQNDGVGVQKPGKPNDEITAPHEMITLTFKNTVRLTGLFFLDLFTAPDGSEAEIALVSVDGGADNEFTAYEPYVLGGFGFGGFDTDLTGKTFVFAVSNTNDDVSFPDYALGGVDVSPVPLPAGMLLLGTALAGLGLSRRRKA